MAINAFYSATNVFCTCRLLAAIMAIVHHANAVSLNKTEDGLSITGMFFSKLEAVRANHMRGEGATVRLSALQHCIFRFFQ
jgi:hypothetical protein